MIIKKLALVTLAILSLHISCTAMNRQTPSLPRDAKNEEGKTFAHVYAHDGNLEELKNLYQSDTDCLTWRDTGRNQLPLHTAAYMGHVHIIEWILHQNKTLCNDFNKLGETPLHSAVFARKIEAVQSLLDAGANVNAQEHGRGTPLHLAALWSSSSIVELLIKRRAKVDARNCNNETPLHLAAVKNNFSALRVLLKCGAKVDARNRHGQTPLHLAASNVNSDAIDILLQAGANSDIRCNSGKTPQNYAEDKGASLKIIILFLRARARNVSAASSSTLIPLPASASIHIAALKNDISSILYHISQGKKVNELNNFGYSALHYATYKGYLGVIFELLKNGADCNIRSSRFGITPLLIASNQNVATRSQEKFEMNLKRKKSMWLSLINNPQLDNYEEEELLDVAVCDQTHNVWENNVNAETNLHCNAYRNIVDMLLQNGADTNIKDRLHNKTPLEIAAATGSVLVTKEIIKRVPSADQNEALSKALIQGLLHGHCKIVACILSQNPTLLSHDYNAIISAAGYQGSVENIELLLKHGLHVNAINSQGETLLHRTAFRGNVQAVRFLLENSADANIQDETGFTPLHSAAVHFECCTTNPEVFLLRQKNYARIVQLLLDAGANPKKRNKEGKTALHVALNAPSNKVCCNALRRSNSQDHDKMLNIITSIQSNRGDHSGRPLIHPSYAAYSSAAAAAAAYDPKLQ